MDGPWIVGILLALFALCMFVVIRQRKKRRVYRVAIIPAPDPLPPLKFDNPAPATQADVFIHPVPATEVDLQVRVQLIVPDMGDATPATEAQLHLLSEWLGNEASTKPFTKRQASLLLDICHYVNGIWVTITEELPNKEIMIVLISSILDNESLWRRIRAWGRSRYHSGRSSFKSVLALVQEILNDPQAWLARRSVPSPAAPP